MVRKLTFGVCLSANAIALLGVQPAAAQSAPGPAADESQAADPKSIEDIIVIARRRAEESQDVPLSITALSGDALEQRNVVSAEELRNFAPALNISGQSRDQAQFYIRGQGPGIIQTGQNNFSSVATYFAEVPTTIAGSGTFFDLSSVQVLKGPQGTLFGRNTTGGAVLFEPERPKSTWGGYLKGTYGNFNYREVEGLLNIPIVPDHLEVRLAGVTSRRDGYTRSIITNQLLDSRNFDSFRVSVLVKPVDGFESLTIFDHREADNSGSSEILRQVSPGAQLGAYVIDPSVYPLLGINPATVNPANPPTIPFYAGTGAASVACLQAAIPGCPTGPYGGIAAALQAGYFGGGLYVVAPTSEFNSTLAEQQALGARLSLMPMLTRDRELNWGITNKSTWDISDALTLKNIIAFRRARQAQSIDFDGTPLNTITQYYPTTQPWQVGQDQFTEEFQVQGKASDSISYILGYFHSFSTPGFDQQISVAALEPLNIRVPSNRDQSDAVFAHAEFEITKAFQLSGGFRYTWDKREASSSIYDPAGQCIQQDPQNPGTVAAPIYTCPITYSAAFKAPTWDITAQYKASENVLLYGAYRRGYKSGGFNLPAVLPQYRDFGKETVDDFEVGLKADWDIGVPLRTNIAVFYDKYKDIQISIPTVIPGVGLASLVQNVGKATNKGFEFETTLIPVKRLALTAFLSYLDSHSDVNVPGTPAIIGRQTAFQPKWKYGFGVNYSIPVMGDGVVALIADYSWQSAVNTNDFVSPIQTYPSYGLLNARIEWTNFLTKGVDLSVFGSNLTQKTYIQGGFALAPQLGFESDFYGEPRTYGVSLKVHFGEY